MKNDGPSDLLPTDQAPLSDVGVGYLINGRYEILSRLGQGGVSVAFKALDTKLEKLVTIKFLLPHRDTNAKDIARFQREAMTAGQLSHSAIANVFSFDRLDDSRPFLVMEFIDGQTLADRIEQEGQLPIEETLDIFIQVSDALSFAHDNGILHRDIKPSNIIIVTNSSASPIQVKVLDFGLAKLLPAITPASLQITETGELLGSPFYMSPEQARGATLDARSDLYSLGCSLYEALTGGPPHLGQTPLATILRREKDKPISMNEASMGRTFPHKLENLVSKLLETDPAKRYQSADEVKSQLITIKSAGNASSAAKPAARPARSQPAARVSFSKESIFYIALSLIAAVAVYFFVPKPAAKRPVTISDRLASPASVRAEFDWVEAQEYMRAGDDHKHKQQYKEALECYQRALAIHKRNSMSFDSDSADALVDMTDCYLLQGQYSEAKKSLAQAVDIYSRLFGDRKNMSLTLDSLGIRFLKQDSIDAEHAWQIAEPFFRRSIAIHLKHSKAYYQPPCISLANQADACFSRKLYREAQWRYEKALPVLMTYWHLKPSEFASMVCNLAETYLHTGSSNRFPSMVRDMDLILERTPASERGALIPYIVRLANLTGTQGRPQDTQAIFEISKNWGLEITVEQLSKRIEPPQK